MRTARGARGRLSGADAERTGYSLSGRVAGHLRRSSIYTL